MVPRGPRVESIKGAERNWGWDTWEQSPRLEKVCLLLIAGGLEAGEAPWDFPEEVAEWPCPALPHLGLQSPVTGPAGTHPGCLGCGEGRGGDRWLDICGESAGSL